MARGRGRLSSVEMLPPEASDDVLWANQELYARKRPISEIFAEFNGRLEAKGIPPISRTAFYARSTKVADVQRRMREKREMFAGLSDEFGAEDIDQNNVMLGDFIMTLISELVDDAAGRRTPKDAMELAKAYNAVIAGQKVSAERRVKLQAELASKTEKAVREVGKQQGWSADTVDAALAKILGVELVRK